MSKPVRTDEELWGSHYIRQGEIERLLSVGTVTARRIFTKAMQMDKEEVDIFSEDMVRTDTVFAAVGTTRAKFIRAKLLAKKAACDLENPTA